MDKLVSIIVPVYNTENYINECLNSVINQTHKNIEVIVINDGSKDNSAQVCNTFTQDTRVRFIDRENKGLSYTRQEGIDLANGEYFCTLDSDDKYDLSFVEKMLQKITENEADICICERKDFDENYEKDILLKNSKNFYLLNKSIVENEVNLLTHELWLADSWNKIYRTDFVRKSGVRFWLDNRYNGTDLSFNHLLLLHCPSVCIVNEPLLLHRIVQGSRVHRKNKPLQEGFEIIIDKVFDEANALQYSKEFYLNYSKVYLKFLGLVFSAILDECDNLSELRKRTKAYFTRCDEFGEKYPVLELGQLSHENKSKVQLLYNTAMLSKKITMVYVVYILKRIKKFMCQ